MTRQEKVKSKESHLFDINFSDTIMANRNLDLIGFGKMVPSHDPLI